MGRRKRARAITERERRAVLNIAGAEKKLRQARFFFCRLEEASKNMPPLERSPEPLEFFFSACLSAAKSAYEVLRKTGGTTFRGAQDRWRSQLPEPEWARFERMMKLRDRDVHFASTETESLPKYVEDDRSRHRRRRGGFSHSFGSTGPDALVEMENPDGTKVSGHVLQGTVGLYLKQQGRRVEAATACREFIDHLGSLLEAMRVASRQDKAPGWES